MNRKDKKKKNLVWGAVSKVSTDKILIYSKMYTQEPIIRQYSDLLQDVYSRAYNKTIF